MTHQIKNCHSCPLLHTDEKGWSCCMHPNGTLKTEYYNIYSDDELINTCPLKVVDLILTVRK